jgi:hypothetical protein
MFPGSKGRRAGKPITSTKGDSAVHYKIGKAAEGAR